MNFGDKLVFGVMILMGVSAGLLWTLSGLYVTPIIMENMITYEKGTILRLVVRAILEIGTVGGLVIFTISGFKPLMNKRE